MDMVVGNAFEHKIVQVMMEFPYLPFLFFGGGFMYLSGQFIRWTANSTNLKWQKRGRALIKAGVFIYIPVIIPALVMVLDVDVNNINIWTHYILVTLFPIIGLCLCLYEWWSSNHCCVASQSANESGHASEI